jgi:hypothetical protein
MKGLRQLITWVVITYFIFNRLISCMQSIEFDFNGCDDTWEDLADGTRFHQREWSLNGGNKAFCTSYSSSKDVNEVSAEERLSMEFETDDYSNFWGTLYARLVKHNRSTVTFLVDSLQRISNANNLPRQELAELAVTFVQDIPYSYVLNIDCATFQTYGKPCIGNIPYGIISPYEFLHTLYGDCDTRAVLLYILLEDLGFDPMIAISHQYAHAMIALNIPATGSYLTHRGIKYYMWETTAKGWQPGMLPPDANNISYWSIALHRDMFYLMEQNL